jgi:hypothetical protein
VTKQHFGAIVAVLVGYVFCRILSYHVVDALAHLSGHRRAGDSVVGAVLGALPFAVLVLYTALQLRGADVEHLRWLRVVAVVGWLVAGAIMGLLPYSRIGTETHLVVKERLTAPGFLHALDVTIVVGLLVTVGLLLVSLRSSEHVRR